MSAIRVAVASAGMIGKRHIEEVEASEATELSAIVDSGPAGAELAQKYTVPLYQSLTERFEKDKPVGVILATPN